MRHGLVYLVFAMVSMPLILVFLFIDKMCIGLWALAEPNVLALWAVSFFYSVIGVSVMWLTSLIAILGVSLFKKRKPRR